MNTRPGPINTLHCALFLDVDGTLLGIESHPDRVVADAALRELLDRLSLQTGGALALVSGRTLAALDRIFAPLVLPAAGAHGSELRASRDGAHSGVSHVLPAGVFAALEDFAAAHDGLVLEPKPGGASLHYRRAPELEHECRRLLHTLMDGLWSGHRLIDGKMVLELVPAGASKGDAIRTLMHEVPFAGRRPVFIGDDTTDEDGFNVVNAMGGTSIRVGALDGSAALYAFDNVAEVREWLAATAAATDGATRGDSAFVQS